MLHPFFNSLSSSNYVLTFLEETLSILIIFGLFIDQHCWRFYWKIVELESLATRQLVGGFGEANGSSASRTVLTSD